MTFQNLLQGETRLWKKNWINQAWKIKQDHFNHWWNNFKGKRVFKVIKLIISVSLLLCRNGKDFFCKNLFPSTHSICLQSSPCPIYNSDPLSPFSLFLLFMNRDPEKTDIIWLHKYPLALAEINIHTGYIWIGCTTQMITKGNSNTIWINQTLGILYNFFPSHSNEQSMVRIRTQTTSCMSCARTSYK